MSGTVRRRRSSARARPDRPPAHPPAADQGRRHGGAAAVRLFALPELLSQLLDRHDDRWPCIYDRDARPRPADRPGRHGLAVPVRAAGHRRLGRRPAAYATSIPFPLLSCSRRAWSPGCRALLIGLPGAAAGGPVPGADHADGGGRRSPSSCARSSSRTAAAGSSATRRPATRRRRPPARDRAPATRPTTATAWSSRS